MTVLAIAHDMPPSLNPQAIQIGRLLYHLAALRPVVIATSPSRTRGRCDTYEDWPARAAGSVTAPSILDDRLLGLRMRMAPVLYRLPDSCRADAVRLERAILRGLDPSAVTRLITFACPFSMHLLGLKLRKLFRVPWIAHFSDPWATNPLMGFGPFSRLINRRWEGEVVATADKLIFVSEETRRLYARLYPSASGRMEVIEHAIDPELYASDISAPAADLPLVIRFLGNLYGGRNLDTLFAALQQLSRRDPRGAASLRMELVLSFRRPLEKRINASKLGELVSVRPPVDYRESLRLMQSAGALFLMETPFTADAGENPFYPSKLADYMGARRPIIGVGGIGATRRILASYGGQSVEPGNSDELADVLSALVESWRADRLASFRPSEAFLATCQVKEKAASLDRILG